MAITFYNDLVLHSVIVIGSINLRIYVLGSNKVSDVQNLVLVQERAIEDLTKKWVKLA